MNMRSFWWLALAFTLTWIWLEWMQFTAQKEQQTLQTSTAQEVPVASTAMPQDAAVPSANMGGVGHNAVPTVQEAMASGQRITVKTDQLELVIDTQGGIFVMRSCWVTVRLQIIRNLST